jgi:hypothetical protein
MHRCKSVLVRVASAIAAIALLAIPTSANAATSQNGATSTNATIPSPGPPAGAATTDMHVVGFDAAIAIANGYEVRTAPDGRQFPVTAGADLADTPLNVVGGNCGFSYVYEYGIGNRAVELYTGYSVIAPVYQWHWTVRLDDRGGSSYRHFDGGFNWGIWQTDRVVGGLTRGGARATVIRGLSVAFLVNGWVCYSGGPYSDTYIT